MGNSLGKARAIPDDQALYSGPPQRRTGARREHRERAVDIREVIFIRRNETPLDVAGAHSPVSPRPPENTDV